MADSTTNTCGNCGHALDESPSTPVEQRQPCPGCGSLGRKVLIEVSDTITVHESVGLKVRHEGERRPFRLGKYGDSLHRLSGKWNRREMTVDRENDRYTERVIDGETGEVIHDVDEPLSDHRGHGSAKDKQP
jgi:hypothetical protein